MKKLLLTIIILLLTIWTTYASCSDISKYNKYTKIDNIKAELLKIWDKIIKKNPDKIEKYIKIWNTEIYNKWLEKTKFQTNWDPYEDAQIKEIWILCN